jgi:hypothetical protein
MKAEFLVMHTDFTADKKKSKVENGKAMIQDKEFILDKTQPIMVNGLLGSSPLYIVNWKSLLPVQFGVISSTVKNVFHDGNKLRVKLSKETVPDVLSALKQGYIDLSLDEGQRFEVTEMKPMVIQEKFHKTELPQMLKYTADMRFLKTMGDIAGKKGKPELGKWMIVLIIAGVMIVAIGLSVAYAMKWI